MKELKAIDFKPIPDWISPHVESGEGIESRRARGKCARCRSCVESGEGIERDILTLHQVPQQSVESGEGIERSEHSPEPRSQLRHVVESGEGIGRRDAGDGLGRDLLLYVESGEGIESGRSWQSSTVFRSKWNPVKELKAPPAIDDDAGDNPRGIRRRN